eukprot:c1242_g1_i1.p1 GENE.c1242_g1_i1~~c1242_g1_i1.p1  ORF type:complete len:180 (-),score=31.48 c1242_g1_i1:17-556(-)
MSTAEQHEEQQDDQGEETVETQEEVHEAFVPEGEELVATSARSKLYRFAKTESGGEWKERGVGCVSFLRYKDTGRVHVVMRREKTHKVCMNHSVSASIKFDQNSGSDKSWVWTAPDFADGEMKTEVFAIKFKTKEDALEFKNNYTKFDVQEAKSESKPEKETEAKDEPKDQAKETQKSE